MLKALLKINLLASFSSFNQLNMGGKKKKTNSALGKVGIVVLLAYLVGCFAIMFGSLFASIIGPIAENGTEELYFAIAGILGLFLSIFGSVFITEKQLFEAQDNELLLSMPIPSGMILSGRMLALMLVNYVYMALAVVPSFAVWMMAGQPITIAGAVCTAVVFLVLPLVSMTISCILAWIIAAIGSKLSDKRIVTMIASLLFLGGYFYLYFNLSNNMAIWVERLTQNASELLLYFKTTLCPLYWLGAACAKADVVSLLLYLACCIVPFSIVSALLSKSFIRIVTTKRAVKTKKYVAGELKVRSPFMAFLHREISRFFGNPTYMLNCGIGLIMMVMLSVFGTFKLNDLPESMLNDPELLGCLVAFILAALNGTVYISAPSVSLEGKNIWISQTCPVSAAGILRAKVLAHIIIALPVELLCVVILAITLKFSLTTALMVAVLTTASLVFCAYLGVCLNLRFPKLDWLNETAVIKQGMAAMFAIFIPMGVFIGLLIAGMPLLVYISCALYLAIVTVVLGITTFIMDCYIKKGGAKKFAHL